MIDREIQDALRVDPSPEFLARVRTRIATERAPTAWRRSWTLAAGVALAAVVTIAVVVSRPPTTTVAPVAVTLPSVAQAFRPANDDAGLKPRATTEPPVAVTLPPVAQAFRPAIVASVVSGFSRTAAQPSEPEILLDHREAAALRHLIAGASDGRVDLRPLTENAPPAPMELPPIDDIVIAPITIEPLTPFSGTEGVRP